MSRVSQIYKAVLSAWGLLGGPAGKCLARFKRSHVRLVDATCCVYDGGNSYIQLPGQVH